MQAIATTLESIPKTKLFNAVGSFYLIAIIIISLSTGMSPWLYFSFLVIAALFIIPSYNTGFKLIILMTMVFERFFTLQPLIIEQQIYKIYPLDIILIFTIISWLIHLKKSKITPDSIWQLPEKLLFIFLILGLLNFVRSFIDPNAQFDIALSTFKNYAFYPLLYFLTIYSIKTRDEFKNIVRLILIAGGIIIGFIIFGIISGQGLWTEYTPLSTSGTRYLAGTHAFYLILAIMIALPLIAFKKIKHPALASMVIWVWLLGIIGSLMRHLWLALIIGAIIIFISLPIKNKKIFASHSVKNGLIALSIFIFMVLAINIIPSYIVSDNVTASIDSINQRATSITETRNDTSATWRIDLWRAAEKAWLTNPIIGVGFGRFIPFESGDWKTYEEIRNIHNSPLAITVQMGVIGILILISFIVSTIIYARKAITANQELAPYYVGLIAGVGVFLFASLFQPYLETNLTGIFLWILLGLVRTSGTINKINDRL